MAKKAPLFLAVLFSIGSTTPLWAMDDQEPEIPQDRFAQCSDEILVDILHGLVPQDLAVKENSLEYNTIIRAFVNLSLVCARFKGLISSLEFSKIVGQKHLNTIFIGEILNNNSHWIPLLMLCGAKAELPEPYMLELDLPGDSYPLPHECMLAMVIANDERSEDNVLNMVKTLVAGGATVTLPTEPTWLCIFTHGTPLDHAIKRKFNQVIDYLLSQGAPIEQQSVTLAQETDQQIYVRLMRWKLLNKNQNSTINRPQPSCTLL